MFGTYIGNNKMLVKLAYGGMLQISSDDLSLMPSLVTTGVIEAPLTKFFINYIKPGQTIVDIGANVGYFTILAAKLVGITGKIIGFEANPNVYEILKDNISMNWLNQQTILYNKAIYSKDTLLNFHSSHKFHGDSSIHLIEKNENALSFYTTIQVEAIPLDSQFNKLEYIDLLKIDIEGGEYQAFLGMLNLIEQKKIKQIIFEWNKTMLGDEYSEFISLLNLIHQKYNGDFYILDQEGNPTPTTIDMITSIDFYPFALIKFT